jgi:hypothetical protein
VWQSLPVPLALVAAVLTAAFYLPAVAVAFLPDGRIYEQVSPPNKQGNFIMPGPFVFAQERGVAEADGNGVLYGASGSLQGQFSSGIIQPVISRHAEGVNWQASSALPREIGFLSLNTTLFEDALLQPSKDFSTVLFTGDKPYSPEQPPGPLGSDDVYLSSNPLEPPAWLGKPTIDQPIPQPGYNRNSVRGRNDVAIVGLTADGSTAFFGVPGTLLPVDAIREGHLGAAGEEGEDAGTEQNAWGFYETHDGKVSEAGILPDSSLSPYGALPAAFAGSETALGNGACRYSATKAVKGESADGEISEDGSRVFFVSPQAIVGAPEPPQLYVREILANGDRKSVLVSRDDLLQGGPAPSGVQVWANANSFDGNRCGTYAYGSPDGSHVIFKSVDRLTASTPAIGSPYWYRYDVLTEKVEYMASFTGTPVASSRDGSGVMFFEEPTATLKVWRGGEAESTETVVHFEGSETSEGLEASEGVARASTDGNVFEFQTREALPGFNDFGNYRQIFRYEAPTKLLTCVSCPPAGVTPSGDAETPIGALGGYSGNSSPQTLQEVRIISADGSRVFFDSPDPLVGGDVDGKRDVYEWENGHLFLISSGTNTRDSVYFDNSTSGSDVFFTTDEGLISSDRDGAGDLYDARIPHPGDFTPPREVPCEGDVCQGPPSIPQLLSLPASSTFDGIGNIASEVKKSVATKTKQSQEISTRNLAIELKKCKKKSKRTRAACERRARRKHAARGSRYTTGNGRGN